MQCSVCREFSILHGNGGEPYSPTEAREKIGESFAQIDLTFALLNEYQLQCWGTFVETDCYLGFLLIDILILFVKLKYNIHK